MLLLGGILNGSSFYSQEENEDVEIIKQAAEEAKLQIRAGKVNITSLEDLKKVARIAYNNNEIADNIAELVYKVGKDGVINIEESNSLQTEYKISDGMQFDKGYISPHMITDYGKMEAIIDGALILVTDKKITNHKDVLPIMQQVAASGKKELVIIADDIDGDALSTMVVNKLKDIFSVIAITAPYYGERRKEFYLDVCAVSGATLISDDFGTTLKDCTLEQLGFADKVKVTKDTTTIIGGKKDDKQMDERNRYYNNVDEEDIMEANRMRRNLAAINGGVGVIKVGANTKQEVDAMIPKIENVANSVMAAFKGGVVRGSGLSLYSVKTSSEILNEALKIPLLTICNNCNIEFEEPNSLNDAYNFVTEENGYFMDVGVMDAADVICAAIDSAVSIACLLLSSKGMLVDIISNQE
jgi:chaperonin GroEL